MCSSRIAFPRVCGKLRGLTRRFRAKLRSSVFSKLTLCLILNIAGLYRAAFPVLAPLDAVSLNADVV
eukprot:5168590-Pyramimonas_sp.AAC.1